MVIQSTTNHALPVEERRRLLEAMLAERRQQLFLAEAQERMHRRAADRHGDPAAAQQADAHANQQEVLAEGLRLNIAALAEMLDELAP